MTRDAITRELAALAAALVAARAEITQLRRMLGMKTLEAELLKEAADVARAKKWLTRVPLFPLDDH